MEEMQSASGVEGEPGQEGVSAEGEVLTIFSDLQKVFESEQDTREVGDNFIL